MWDVTEIRAAKEMVDADDEVFRMGLQGRGEVKVEKRVVVGH